MSKYRFLLIVFILLVGSLLRFYKLDWGQGLFTHPDEYHIVSSVKQLSFPNQMHPHFFSYGTVTIYLIYFTQELLKFFFSSLKLDSIMQNLTLNPFILGRFYSALFSSLTIIIVYKICTLFMQRRFSYLAALLVALTPGLIQQAHFATPESNQIFFLFGSLLFIIRFVRQNKILYLALSSIFLGFSLGVKVSSIVFSLPLIVAAIINSHPKNLSFKTPALFMKQTFKKLLRFTTFTLIIIVTTATVCFSVAPYVFLDFTAFWSNLNYEGGLALGRFPVFYTRQFINTMPVLFQIEKILPYALGPSLLFFSSLGFTVAVINLILKRKKEIFIVIVAFLSLYIPNAFLFAKWTRFIAPTFPFFAMFTAFFLDWIYAKNRSMSNFLTVLLLITTFLWTATFMSIYLRPDIRITASNWIEKNFPENSTILIEGGNMIDIPLKGNFERIGYIFYNLETDAQARSEIASGFNRADYFLVQSRRVFMNHQRLPDLYPKTSSFYDALFNGRLGFEQINEFHSFPMLKIGEWKLEIPDENAEETWSVFDHPVIRIFKKTRQLSIGDYEKIFDN